jgi:hypothetical protein
LFEYGKEITHVQVVSASCNFSNGTLGEKVGFFSEKVQGCATNAYKICLGLK